mgnify:CR=1 FL=1
MFSVLKSFATVPWPKIFEFLPQILNLHVSLSNVLARSSLRQLVPVLFNFKTASLIIEFFLVLSSALSFFDGLKFVVLFTPLELIAVNVGLTGINLF